jgi:FtsH-binding integral membrane protein
MKNDIPTIIHAAFFGFAMNGVIWRIEAGQLDNIIFQAVISVISATIVALRIRLNSPPNA